MAKEYFKTSEKTTDFTNQAAVSSNYAEGYVFTRIAKGHMIQTRSLRIDLSKFKLSSENKRILKKVEDLNIEYKTLPLEDYSWEIHKMGKDFYSQKFGDGTMSAAKIKEMFQDSEASNMNGVMRYELRATGLGQENAGSGDDRRLPVEDTIVNNGTEELAHSSQLTARSPLGYALCYVNDKILHYAYPFYDLNFAEMNPNIGLGMMLKAVLWAQEGGKKYVYLGSVVDSSSRYKLQFEGLEWWDEKEGGWSGDIGRLKGMLVGK